MSEKSAKPLRLLNAMIALLNREARALSNRNFEAIASLSKEKAAILEKFEELARNLTRSNFDDSIERHLETVAAKAKDNAEQLIILRNGLSDAQRRLGKIVSETSLTGAYSREGEAIRCAPPGHSEREA